MVAFIKKICSSGAMHVLLIVLVSPLSATQAATIYLKDEKSITGEITSETDTAIKIKERVGTGYGEMEYSRSVIDRVVTDAGKDSEKTVSNKSKIKDSYFYYVAEVQIKEDSDLGGVVGTYRVVIKAPDDGVCQKLLAINQPANLISRDCYPSSGEYEKYFKLETNANWYLANQINGVLPQVNIFEWNTVGESIYSDFDKKLKLVRMFEVAMIATDKRDGLRIDAHIISPQGEVDTSTGKVISDKKTELDVDPSVDGVISYEAAVKGIVPQLIQKMSHAAWEPPNVNHNDGEADDKVAALDIKSYDNDKIEFANLDIQVPSGDDHVRYLYQQRELLVKNFIHNMFPEWANGFACVNATIQKMFHDASLPSFDPKTTRFMDDTKIGKKQLRIKYNPTYEVNMEVTQDK